MKRNALLAVAAAAILVALAVVFAPYAVGQRKDGGVPTVEGEQPLKGASAAIVLKAGRHVYVSRPRTKTVAGRGFVGGDAIGDTGGIPIVHWIPVSEVAQIDEFATIDHLSRIYRVTGREPVNEQKSRDKAKK